jgi:hypothetical protein
VFARFVLRTERGPLRLLWAFAYEGITRVFTAYLRRGEPGSAAYARASMGLGSPTYGMSDIDTAIVLPSDPEGRGLARARVRERAARFCSRLPFLCQLLLDPPLVLEDTDLRAAAGAPTLTYGLGGRPRAGEGGTESVYFGPASDADRIRLHERPGLYGPTDDWRRLWGPERRPAVPPRNAQLRRVAAWLELQFVWRWAFHFCVEPESPRAAGLSIKLAADPARIWLWLAHGERADGAEGALARGAERLPVEEAALRRALELRSGLGRARQAPLAETLPTLVRLSSRIAALLESEVEGEGATEVRLAWDGEDELGLSPTARWRHRGLAAAAPGLELLPLADWRALVRPAAPDETFAVLPGDPGDPVLLADRARASLSGPYPALRAQRLLVLPTQPWPRSALRAVQCPLTDPVSFALAEGRGLARFPNVPGWSAQDAARRAVAEHRAWLASPAAAREPTGESLAMLLTAARAALFLESIVDGSAEVPLTAAAALRRLVESRPRERTTIDEAAGAYGDFLADETAPPAAAVTALRELVAGLRAYSGGRGPLAAAPGNV